jgi:hypothetical protein
MLSFVYGTFLPSFTAHTLAFNPFSVKDALALFFIVHSAKRRDGGRGLTRVGGVSSLLDKILKDATAYFLVLSTGHLLLLFFEIFAPVSERPPCRFLSYHSR